MFRFAVGLFVYFCFFNTVFALGVNTAVIRIDYQKVAPISRLDEIPDDDGFAGGKLATKDNQTTGRFQGINFQTAYEATTSDNASALIQSLRAQGTRIFVILANDEDTLNLSELAGTDALVLNAGSENIGLRNQNCRSNLLHMSPSLAMRADAIMQFIVWKRWKKAALIHGSNQADENLAEAYRHSAKKFGISLVEERQFKDRGGSRRTDTGHVLVQRQIPVFSQNIEPHDVIIAADQSDVFAPYLPFHLWTPRPVVGSAGLRPVSFTPVTEAWGATQFQRRFEKESGRHIRESDYNVWLALRTVGEAVTRTMSNKPAELQHYMLSEAFELAAFKGRKLTFRKWNGQLRQPIFLTDGRMIVSVSPQDGFLHQKSTLDSLGLDEPESLCEAFR